MRYLLLLLTIALPSCVSGVAQDTRDYRALASAALAAAVIQPDEGSVVVPEPTPNPSPSECTHCGGRGYIVHGDGHRTPCPHCSGGDPFLPGAESPECECPGECKCDPCECPKPARVEDATDTEEVQAAPVEPRRLAYFTASWCIPCQQNKPALEEIKEAGELTVGYKATDSIQVIDIDANPHLARRYRIGAVPTYIVIVNEREIHREVGGPRTAEQFTALYHYGEKG